MRVYKFVEITKPCNRNYLDLEEYMNWARFNNWNLIGFQQNVMNGNFSFIWDGEDCKIEPSQEEYEVYLDNT